MQVQAYLFFEGRCEEALEFYGKAMGARVEMLMRNKDNPEPSSARELVHGTENKVMHASFRVGNTLLMASDGRCSGAPSFAGFALPVTVREDAEAERIFTALGEGGTVVQPLIATFFASKFGMVTDRFGVLWMVLADPNEPAS